MNHNESFKKTSLILLDYFLNISKTSDFTSAFFTVFFPGFLIIALLKKNSLDHTLVTPL